jgi:hypothetical protein
MVKDSDADGSTPKFSFEEELKQERAKNIDLEAKGIAREKRVGQLEKEISRLRKEKGADDSLPETPAAPTPAPAPVPEPEKQSGPAPHIVKSYQPRFCADCGTQNPSFKDETVCSTPGCGVHLGSMETVKTLKACPNCGGSKFDQIKK